LAEINNIERIKSRKIEPRARNQEPRKKNAVQIAYEELRQTALFINKLQGFVLALDSWLLILGS